MTTLIKEFNETHPDIVATPVYTGTYDETLIKTRAAIKAGKPPAAVDHVGELPDRPRRSKATSSASTT